ncbi:hypothetical protein [Micromonospora zamorensis]|uniref:hypothetical protein n=1 Tax=Micromonospora zamorensis TaxID=709883 RepID=UPI0037927181
MPYWPTSAAGEVGDGVEVGQRLRVSVRLVRPSSVSSWPGRMIQAVIRRTDEPDDHRGGQVRLVESYSRRTPKLP